MQERGEKMQGRKFVVDEFDEKAIFLCQFCGGQDCDHQNYLSNKKMPNAIEGLNSNWITPNILAMQRPSERLIKEFNIYQQFKDQNIKAVLNLQEPGEHPYCGDGILPHVGFSYIPENFYYHGIKCFSECWEDMTSTTFQHMMRIMNIFDTVLVVDEGKISVHCHAGRGRTLLVICSWIIYHDRMPVDKAIQLAREKRQGVLASRNQINFLEYFEEQLKKRWISFEIDEQHKSFDTFVEWQTLSLLKKEKRRTNQTSVAHYQIMHQLRRIAKTDSMSVIQAFLTSSSFYFTAKWDSKSEEKLEKLKESFNIINFQAIKEEQDPRILTQLLFDYYDNLPFTLLTSLSIECLKQQALKSPTNDSKLKLLSAPSVVHSFGVSTVSTILDLVHFCRELLQVQKERAKSDSKSKDIELEAQTVNAGIQWTFYMRLSLLLLFKRKYFPQLFIGQNFRDCRLYKLGPKVHKIVGKHALFLGEFLSDLSKQLPEEHADIEALVFRVKKVESNLYYLLKEGKHGNFLSGSEKETVYESARVKR